MALCLCHTDMRGNPALSSAIPKSRSLMIGGLLRAPNAILRSVFGTSNDRLVKQMQATVDAINAIEPEVEALSDEALRGRTQQFRDRLKQGEKLDDILVEAFATVREAAKRTLGQRHFDVQILGGMGYSAETDMQRYWRDARLWQIGPITNEMARNGIAERLGLPRSF